ncbi:MAG: PilN domain-containing protein [Fimbriimonadia bacterium]
MPLVNLISEQRTQKRVAIRKTRASMLAWVISLGAGVAAVGALMWQVDRQSDRLAELKSKSAGMQPYQHAIAEGQKELAVLRPKLTTLQAASRATETWHRLLGHVASRMPEGTWLTSVRAQEAKAPSQGVEVRFIGYAQDQSLVGMVMQRLNECPDLAQVDLKYTKEKESGNNVGVEFEVVAMLAVPKDARAKEGGKAVGS